MTETQAPFEAQLLAERGRLVELARALVRGSDVDAQDVVHDVLLIALDHRDRPRMLGAWLRQVLRNRVRAGIRRKRPREAVLHDMPVPEPSIAQDDALATAQIADAAWNALEQIGEPYFSAVHRRFIDALSAEEIARIDGVPAATVRWRIHEGLRRIRADLDARFEGRTRWCGGLAPLLVLPVPITRGTTMSTFSILKLASLLVGLGLVGTAIVHAGASASQASEADGPAALAVEATARSVGLDPAPEFRAEDAQPSALQSIEAAESEEEPDPAKLLGRGIKDCIASAPEGSLAGLERLELDMYVFGADEGTVFHKVNVTTGRMDPADDPELCSLGEADAPGVIHHAEIRQCILDTIDPAWLPTPPPIPGEYSGFGSHIIPLDGNGHVKPRERPPIEPGAELPDVRGEELVDPPRAVETFALAVDGPADASVQIVECGSYDCPFCKKSEATLAALRERFPKMSVAWLEMPSSGLPAILAAKASVAAARQGQFWAFHRALFELDQPHERAAIVALADQIGLDRTRFEADLDDPATARTVALQKETCRSAGVWATPTFFVNGDIVRGELGVEQMGKTIAEIVAVDD